MRDRLIELLKGAETKVTEMLSSPLALEEWLGIYADHLLENGVIVPPCKVGDTVYVANMAKQTVEEHPIKLYERWSDGCEYLVTRESWLILPDSIGKTVFLTREEAERALKGGAE